MTAATWKPTKVKRLQPIISWNSSKATFWHRTISFPVQIVAAAVASRSSADIQPSGLWPSAGFGLNHSTSPLWWPRPPLLNIPENRAGSPPTKPQNSRQTIGTAAPPPESMCHWLSGLTSSAERNATAIAASKSQWNNRSGKSQTRICAVSAEGDCIIFSSIASR